MTDAELPVRKKLLSEIVEPKMFAGVYTVQRYRGVILRSEVIAETQRRIRSEQRGAL